MPTFNLIDFLNKGFEAADLEIALASRKWPQLIQQVTGSQKTALAACLLKEAAGGLIVTFGEEQARRWIGDLQSWLPHRHVYLFPPMEWLSLEVLSRSRRNMAERLRVFNALARKENVLIVAPIQALIQKVETRQRWHEVSLFLQLGETYALDGLARELVKMGYKREEIVEEQGCFAVRGGILDIAPLGEVPLRVEFFDDEIDSIRYFNLETQKSSENTPAARVAPALEIVLSATEREAIKRSARTAALQAAQRLTHIGNYDAVKRLENKRARLEDHLERGLINENIYPYLALLEEKLVSFLDWLPAGARVILDEPLRIREQADFLRRQRAEDFVANLEKGEEYVDAACLFTGFEEIVDIAADLPLIALSSLNRSVPGLVPKYERKPTCKTLSAYAKASLLLNEIDRWLHQGYALLLCAGDDAYAGRLVQGLRERGSPVRLLGGDRRLEPGEVYVANFAIDNGFELPLSKIAIFTETEIYHRERKYFARTQRQDGNPENGRQRSRRETVRFGDLQPGDYVVHVHHGVGKFTGIEKIEVDGTARDFFTLKYAGEDRLYVPLHQVQYLQKYLGTDAESTPRLNRLGGNEWAKAKSKARDAVRELAIDLLELYAQREQAQGFAFPPDSVWQQEFEEEFEYEETPDQAQCILEVKKDMMKARPMDRLLCGDVGYGKTEVAMRAIFKAVTSGKQVAVLVPTTILAQQHFMTFQERFKNYPIKIELLCRLRTAKEQKMTVKSLRDGSVDIVIGTHRLISPEIRYKDLGLLVIDEEQRFGVEQKEKIKSLKQSIDVLTLSATPIPRTLYMSLAGLRDMSLLSTPPEDRYPVQTYVAEHTADLVRGALERELQRGGQVFYVYNRIEGLEKVAAYIQEMAPEARVSIVHGRMKETQMEREMLAFINREKDVLVCTTIIESGLDIANANTLIVDETDHFGLNQLYQLRGRIGRSNRKAYAYFLYAPRKILTEEAENRLATIREFTEFGSGYKIALRDLEIRGAGNLIGGEQHGHLTAVGFNLYMQMLQREVQKLRAEKGRADEAGAEYLLEDEDFAPSIDLKIQALLPDEYIVNRQVKGNLYQRILGLTTDEEIEAMKEELADRFGTLPRPAENLFQIVKIRARMKRLKIDQISQNKSNLTVRFIADPGFTGEQFMALIADFPHPISIAATDQVNLELRARLRSSVPEDLLRDLYRLLARMAAAKEAQLSPKPES